ncbi:MAG TPA: DUF167 domain-containing protein [Candidatus Angelobacter sp.]|nr:DUF167 domain-containing protein [Candidatus Angelobacter sp.]
MKIVVTVKPNSTKGPLIEPQADGSLVVYIREIAADGKANEALMKLLAKHFKISKTHISIVQGHTSKHKIIELS